MMKKFLFLIITSVLVGMFGAYVTLASAAGGSCGDGIKNNGEQCDGNTNVPVNTNCIGAGQLNQCNLQCNPGKIPVNSNNMSAGCKDAEPSTVSVGDFIWLDANKDGLQTSGEVGVPNINLDLYECDPSQRGFTRYSNGKDVNMDAGYKGNKIASTSTDANGAYIFNGLDSNKLYYVQYKNLNSIYSLTSQFKDGYATYGQTNSNFSPGTQRSTCESPEMAVDGGLIVSKPDYCVGSVMEFVGGDDGSSSPIPNGQSYPLKRIKAGGTIQYRCNTPVAGVTTWLGVDNMRYPYVKDMYGNTPSLSWDLSGDPKHTSNSERPRYSAQIAQSFKVDFYGVTCKVGDITPHCLKIKYPTSNAVSVLQSNQYLYGTTTFTDTGSYQVRCHAYKATDNPTDNPTNDCNSLTVEVGLGQVGPIKTIGNYVWIDAIKNGTQDAGEVGVEGVKVELYKLSACGDALGTPVSTTTTNSEGYYMFTKLDNAKYRVKFVLPVVLNTFAPAHYEFIVANIGTNDAIDSDADTNGVSQCIDLQQDDLTVDAGVVVVNDIIGPVSCEGNSVIQTPTSTGARIDYVCSHIGGTSGRFEVYSGIVKLYMVNGFTGSVNVPYGSYITQCVINGTVTYKVSKYVFAVPQICSYKQHITTNEVCAVKSSLSVIMINPLKANTIIGALNPISYCTNAQDSNKDYICKNSVPGDTVYVRDDMACMKAIIVPVVSPVVKVGGRVWHDVDKNGIQNISEAGVSGSAVSLYTCSGTLVSSRTTDAIGNYVFDQLISGSYKVRFGMPAGYDTFTDINAATSTSSNDSNANSAGETACTTFVGGETNLTIDAGVYFNNICISCCPQVNLCCGGGCGGPRCGDGTADLTKTIKIGPGADDYLKNPDGSYKKEQCDKGFENGVVGSSCDRYCQNVGITPSPLGTGKIIKAMAKVSMGYIDPPDVMVGEYVPFWWKFDNDPSDVAFVSSCESIPSNASDKLYVIDKTLSSANTLHPDGLTCDFQLSNSAGQVGPVVKRPCNLKKLFSTSELTTSYLQGKNSTVENTSYANANGASVITPQDWGTSFTKLGEYGITWKSIEFTPCIRNTPSHTEYNTGTNSMVTVQDPVYYTKSAIRHKTSESTSVFRLTVSKPYLMQKNGLVTSVVDTDIVNSIIGSNGVTIVTNAVKSINFKGSSNLTYLLDGFINKYVGIATQASSPMVGLSMGKKVASKDIYVYHGNQILISNAKDLGNKTIIVKDGNLTIKGEVKGNLMIIVPNGTITFESLDATQIQNIQGIYIAKNFNSPDFKNNDLDQQWTFDGRLNIKGSLINIDSSSVTLLRDARRSVLAGWFNVRSDESGKQKDRDVIIKKGGALMIESDPGLWLNLPPGANEIITALQAYK